MLERVMQKRQMAPATNSLVMPEKLAGPDSFDLPQPPHGILFPTERPLGTTLDLEWTTRLVPPFETPAPAPIESSHPPPSPPWSQPLPQTPLRQPSRKPDMPSSVAKGPPTLSVSVDNEAKDVSLASLVWLGHPNMLGPVQIRIKCSN